MKWLIFILLIPTAKADALLDAIYADWGISKMESIPDYSDQEIPDDYEVEVYQSESYSDSWNLGKPDNLPETIIIYEGKDCRCY